jgi:hypothetical protein
MAATKLYEWIKDGKLRQPREARLREDMSPPRGRPGETQGLT